MSGSSKITRVHLARDAYVYIRQSTPTQVKENTESLERQYELAERAQALGWAAHQVVVVDCDLGRSGTETTARDGFQGLVAEVGLSKVGIIFGIEVSRLARNNADWYQLLDLCALTDTLIADGDGVYHPADYNDRLVLGLKGTMSEAELHLIRNRLTAGLRHKAAKGELRLILPVGFDYDEFGKVVMSPDEAIGESIATVFRRFEELQSARQVMMSMRDDNLQIPRRRPGSIRVGWVTPVYAAIHEFLTNPVYAGAFVYGRSRTQKGVGDDGKIVVRTVKVAQSEWLVLIPGHHDGFITWERFELNQKQLRANWRPPRGQGGGPAREGTALLQGRIRCGRCSRMMSTGYSGSTGNSPRYLCAQVRSYGGERACQSFGGRRIDQRVLEEVFKVLEPAALTATAKAIDEATANFADRLAVFQLGVERARYEAERARRKFDAVEPENRLVARTLERTWEEALDELRRAEAELATQRARRPSTLTPEELEWVTHAGAHVRAIFNASTTSHRERKQLLRALIAEVIVTAFALEHRAEVRIVWEGGSTSDFNIELDKRGDRFHATDEDTMDLIRRLSQHYDDTTIARVLSRQRRRTRTGLSFTTIRVTNLRAKYHIPAFSRTVTPQSDNGLVMSAQAAAEELGVSKYTVYRWLREGFIVGEQLTPAAPWRIRVDQDLRDRLAEQSPDGWLPLDDAAKALGVARQTVLQKVQRGELNAVLVRKGKRKGLRIQVERDQSRLFDNQQ